MRRMKKCKLIKLMWCICALFTLGILSGCATGMSKSEYNIDMLSKKPGVHFKVYNRNGVFVHKGVTPEYVTLPAQSEFFTGEKYTFKLDNGQKKQLNSTISPWYFGNIITIVGFGVDGITGAMWSLPPTVHMDSPQSEFAPPGQLGVNL